MSYVLYKLYVHIYVFGIYFFSVFPVLSLPPTKQHLWDRSFPSSRQISFRPTIWTLWVLHFSSVVVLIVGIVMFSGGYAVDSPINLDSVVKSLYSVGVYYIYFNVVLYFL